MIKKQIYIVMNNSESPKCIEGVFDTWIGAFAFFLAGCMKAGIVKDNKEVFELAKIWIVKKEVDT